MKNVTIVTIGAAHTTREQARKEAAILRKVGGKTKQPVKGANGWTVGLTHEGGTLRLNRH
ncbi:hypothetical protein CHUUTOTORO_01960 [Serratia phage vB_SmaM-ChuuTotoro]|nr:hypothetical protein CHUUTOTORO_01960 [Serratia phage vB_SmaM-ChuuTotoro]